jgi:CBS domain-containing protein
MTDASVRQSSLQPTPATVADVMRPPLTTVQQNDHVAAAAYLMKRAGATALIITQTQTGQPIGILTEADISHAVGDGKNLNDVRTYQLMTAGPAAVNTTASIRDAAEIMTSKRFRHLLVIGEVGLIGIVDIIDICRALLEADVSGLPTDTAQPE